MVDITSTRFTDEQVEAALKVDRWTARPDGEAWFVAQVEHTRRLFDRYNIDLLAWREECRQRTENVLRDGHLHQPVPEGEPDQRSHYDIEGIGPSDVLVRVLKHDVETLSKKDRKMLRAALLAILEDRRLDLRTSEFWQYRRDRLDTDQWAVFEYMMWVELPDEPIGPLVATGADYANMSRTDRLAIAATVLLGLHANVMPDHDRLPRSDDLAFDLCAYAAEYERGLRLEGMVNLVEAALDDGPPKLVAHEGIVQIEPWKPTPGYVPASKIRHKDQPIPPSTLNGWRNKNPAAFEKHPATGEWFHPADWVQKRLAKYRPGPHPPNRNGSPKSD